MLVEALAQGLETSPDGPDEAIWADVRTCSPAGPEYCPAGDEESRPPPEAPMTGKAGSGLADPGDGVQTWLPNVARMYDYYLLRHEALCYRVGVRDPRRQAVAAA